MNKAVDCWYCYTYSCSVLLYSLLQLLTIYFSPDTNKI